METYRQKQRGVFLAGTTTTDTHGVAEECYRIKKILDALLYKGIRTAESNQYLNEFLTHLENCSACSRLFDLRVHVNSEYARREVLSY